MSCSWHRFCKTARTRYKVRVDKIRVWSRQTSFTRRLVEAEAGGMIHTRYLVYQVPGTRVARSPSTLLRVVVLALVVVVVVVVVVVLVLLSDFRGHISAVGYG